MTGWQLADRPIFVLIFMAEGKDRYEEVTCGGSCRGLPLMLANFNIVQGMMSSIMRTAGIGSAKEVTLPGEMM